MNLGQLLGGAGVVGQGWRQAEEGERVARQNQLAIEEQNRLAALKARMAQTQVPSFQPVDVAQFTQPLMPGRTMPMGEAPVAPPPAAPAAPAAAPAAGAGAAPVSATTAPAGVQGAPGTLPTPPRIRPAMSQTEADRQALLRPVTAAADVAQAPAAAGLNLVTAAGEAVINLGGRLVNAITGREVAPTDVRGPRWSLTPFYDRYVRLPEQAAQEAAQAQQRTGIPPTPQLPDPQRLIQAMTMVESAGRPGAVSPAGAVGLMQVKPATAMNPGFGVPNIFDFAKERGREVTDRDVVEAVRLLKDPVIGAEYGQRYMDAMLARYNGNLEYALAAYNAGPGRIDAWMEKGADPDKLPKETREYIPKVLAALAAPTAAAPTAAAPTAAAPTAAAPTAAAPTAAPAPLEVPQTQARNMEMAEFYLSNPESIPFELQQLSQTAQQQAALLTRQRNETAQLAQMFMQSGTAQGIEQAMRLRESIGQMDASLLQLQQQVEQKQTYLQGMQGLREFAEANDPRRLSGVLSQMLGVPVAFQPRPDGKWNRFINGQKVQEGLTFEQISIGALRSFSPEARQAASASAALENELALKRKYGDAMVNAMRDIQKAIVDGEYKLAEERAKQANGKLTVDTSKGVAYFQRGNAVFVINPDGRVEEIGGVKTETGPSARPVTGLNLGR